MDMINKVLPKVGLVLATLPASLGFLNPALSDGIQNTLVMSSLLLAGPWLLLKVSENVV